MATLYTPLTDGQLNRAANFNAVFQQLETAILARAGVIATRTAWTTLAVAAPSITINVVAGDNMLVLHAALRSDVGGGTEDSIRIVLNDDVSSTYTVRYALVDTAGTPTSVSNSGVTGFTLDSAATGPVSNASLYSYVMLRIPMASSNAAKPCSYESVMQGTISSTPKMCMGTAVYPGAVAITKIKITPVNGSNFAAGSRYTLLGMA